MPKKEKQKKGGIDGKGSYKLPKEEVKKKVDEYFELLADNNPKVTFGKAGLARYLGIKRTTYWEWSQEDSEMYDIIDDANIGFCAMLDHKNFMGIGGTQMIFLSKKYETKWDKEEEELNKPRKIVVTIGSTSDQEIETDI